MSATIDEQQVPSSSDNRETVQAARRLRNKQILLGLGAVEIVLGLISFALGIVTLGEEKFHHDAYGYQYSVLKLGQGVWCGFILIISGIFGVAAHFRPTKSVFRANVATTVFAVIAMVVLMLMSYIAATSMYYAGTNWALGAMGLVGIIITSIHWGYSYVERSINSTQKRPRRTRRNVYSPPMQQFIAVQLSNGQIMYYPSSQMMPPTGLYPPTMQAMMVPAPNPNQLPQPQCNGQTPILPSYGIPMAYYPPAVPTSQPGNDTSPQTGTTLNYQPGYALPVPNSLPSAVTANQVYQHVPFQSGYEMPTPTAPTTMPSQANEQQPTTQATRTQQSSNSSEAGIPDDPPAYSDSTVTESLL